MSPIPAALSFFLLLLTPFPPSASGQECLYQYLRQPPSQPSCNPYAGISILRVQCQVSVPSSEANLTEILWFYNNQEIAEPFPAVIDVSPQEMVGEKSIITSTLTLDGDSFNDIYQGDYHCQIELDGSNTTAPSNTLVLESELVYINRVPVCDGTFRFSETVTCAGNKSLLVSSATTATAGGETSPVPDTTTIADTSTTAATSVSPTSVATGTVRSPPLQVWVYVLVAIAAVFGMIIVVLAILCVGLCLKKNKTEDTYRQKGSEVQQFTSNSMVSNGLYQRKDEGGVTSGTHFSSHSQISDYNTLTHERDYEVIDMGEDKHDYHHLQRPSPPVLPGGRNFNFTPPKEFHSMSTLTSQIGGVAVGSDPFQHGKMSKNGSYLPKSASEGPEEHVYRELEQSAPSSAGPRSGPVKDIYRSPTNSDSPDSTNPFSRGTFPSMPVNSGVFAYPNESLYTPNLESSVSSRVQQGGLENVPETGSMFIEPVNPTAFPVHKYEKISSETAPYETPVPTCAKTGASPSTLTTSQAGETRLRTNSGARYETELPQAFAEDSQYSRLTRPHEVSTVSSNTTVPLYSEMVSVDNKRAYSQSDAELDIAARRFSEEKPDRGFTMPVHVGTSGGGTAHRNSSVSSATDSLTSYIAQLQAEAENGAKTTTDMDGLLFNEQNTAISRGPAKTRQQYDILKRNGSFDTSARKVSSQQQQQQRAWSEERRESFPNRMNDRSVFSSSTINGGGKSTAAPKMHREMRVNGIDLRLGEYARSKTMV